MARALDGRDVPVLVLGKGSNILVADRGFGGLAVSLGTGFDQVSIAGASDPCRWSREPPGPGPADVRRPG